MPDLTATVEHADGRALIVLDGEVNRTASEPLRAAWAEATVDGQDVVIDFGKMTYLNSSGIAVLVGLLADARVNGVAVAARDLDDHFRHVFEITRIADLMEMETSS
ncbi:MAG: STAS domain-containing protein [Nitriliruptorales bacterium]|nr:STAS domain-containing protein [Nitriliruptorales bacterium]